MAGTLKKNELPSIMNWMDDFWNSDRFFGDRLVSKDLFPAVNVKDRESSYEIELTAPGLRKEDFNIHIENGVLTISSESSKEEEEKNEKFTRKEFRYNAFSRSFSLPDNAKEDDLKALYENGLLKVTIAKKQIESPKRKQIEVS
jgi:HSP20 family protein